MDRHWLLTWTMYGTWLPGDHRGFVSNVSNEQGQDKRHNAPGTLPNYDMAGLQSYAKGKLISEPVRISPDQAIKLADQFRETAIIRGWVILAAALMANHVHLVVGVGGDPKPAELLRDFKSYGSRRLNQLFGQRDRWWSQSGSTRKLPNDAAVAAAIEYVLNQEYPLVIWPQNDLLAAPIPQEPSTS